MDRIEAWALRAAIFALRLVDRNPSDGGTVARNVPANQHARGRRGSRKILGMSGEQLGRQAFVSSLLLSLASMGAMAGLGYVDVVERALPQALSGFVGTGFVFAILIGTPVGVGFVVSRRWRLVDSAPVFFGVGIGALLVPLGVVAWVAWVDDLKLAEAAVIVAMLCGFLVASALYGGLASAGAAWERRRRLPNPVVPTATALGD